MTLGKGNTGCKQETSPVKLIGIYAEYNQLQSVMGCSGHFLDFAKIESSETVLYSK